MSMFTTRQATGADADLIADISRYTFYKTFAAQNTKSDMDKFMQEQFTREMLVKEVFDAANVFLLAYEGENIAGYVKLKSNILTLLSGKQSAVEIARLYSMPAYIGKGVGALLMQQCIDYAKLHSKKVVWLGVWEKNKRAIKFYERWGFKKFASHFFLLGNDLQTDLLMMKWV